MRTNRSTLPWLLLGLLLMLPATTWAADAGVNDDGGFFSPNVAQRANDALQRLNQQYKHKVVFETFATLPNELQGKLDGNETSKNQAYLNFMEMRARSLGADVYIYASKSPGHVDSVARKDVAKSGLTDAGRRRMTSDLLTGFKNRDFDGALTNLTASLERTFAEGGNVQSNTPPAPTANNPSPVPQSRTSGSPGYPPAQQSSSKGLFGGLGCFGLVIGAVVIFIVISLVRRLFGGNRNAPPPLPGQGYGNPPGGYGQGYGQGGYNQGGGGFGRGLGGGLLGGLLGSWIGGNVFGGQSHSSGNDQHSGGGVFGGGNDSGNSGGDPNGFTGGGGGDFGNSDSGSSDFSGGGGGDFGGGGDSGGGGADSGGGGGDF
jgi:hypothetical protein